MKFHEIYLKNLLSFEEATLRLNQTNIIVGPNNAGKTNILRILKLFRVTDNGSPLHVRLNKTMKNDPSQPSAIGFEVELSDQEAIILFRQFFRNNDLKEIGGGFKKLRLLMEWPNTFQDYSYNDSVIMRFDNSMMVVTGGGSILGKGEPLIIFFRKNKSWESLPDFRQRGRSGMMERDSDRLFEVLVEITQNESNLVDRMGEATYFIHYFGASLAHSQRPEIDAETFNFLGVDKTQLDLITIWNFIGKVMSNSIVIMDDARPTPESLAKSMQELKDTHEEAYDDLRNKFHSIFPNVSFKVQKTNNIPAILILEDGRQTPLGRSASGHLSGISMFFMIHSETDKTVFFDEPETHFHPPKLRELSQSLTKSSKSAKNQLTFITHSPALIDTPVLRHDLTNVIYVRREGTLSKICQPQEKIDVKIKEHLFSPEIFLGSGCILVEGISDEHVIRGISDSYDRLLTRLSIALVNLGGKKSIDPCIELLRSYDIPYVAIADSDYDGDSEGVIKLEGNIEDEIERLGWKRKSNADGRQKLNKGNSEGVVKEVITLEGDKDEIERLRRGIERLRRKSNADDKQKLKTEKVHPVIMELLANEDGKKTLQETRLWEALCRITNKVGYHLLPNCSPSDHAPSDQQIDT